MDLEQDTDLDQDRDQDKDKDKDKEADYFISPFTGQESFHLACMPLNNRHNRYDGSLA